MMSALHTPPAPANDTLRDEENRLHLARLLHHTRGLAQVLISLQNVLGFDRIYIDKPIERAMNEVRAVEAMLARREELNG